jgi:phenylalanyl-tRNA synthetase beta chain
MKMYINLLLQNIGFNINKIKSEDISNEIFEQGLTYQINREDVVQFGSVSPAILKRFDIKQPVFYADFNWDVLFSLIQNRDMKYAGIPKFQEVRRDLALLVNEKVTFAEIEKLAYRIGKPLLKKVSLFDVYKGNKIDHDKKSYAVSFNLLNDNKTMNDKEIDSAMEKLMLAFQKELGAEIR